MDPSKKYRTKKGTKIKSITFSDIGAAVGILENHALVLWSIDGRAYSTTGETPEYDLVEDYAGTRITRYLPVCKSGDSYYVFGTCHSHELAMSAKPVAIIKIDEEIQEGDGLKEEP